MKKLLSLLLCLSLPVPVLSADVKIHPGLLGISEKTIFEISTTLGSPGMASRLPTEKAVRDALAFPTPAPTCTPAPTPTPRPTCTPAPTATPQPTPTPQPALTVATGTILLYAGSTAPEGWIFCNGAELSRLTYTALFCAIGTTYGAGDGSSTFRLPDLRGRVPVGRGQGSGLTQRLLGDIGGAETHALTAAENGTHSHSYFDLSVNDPAPIIASGTGRSWGQQSRVSGSSGSGSPHNNMMPFLALNFIIKY